MLQCVFGQCAVCKLVGLRPGSLHSRTPALVKHAELDHGVVYKVGHLASQGVDFPHYVAFGQASHRRVAGKLSYGVYILSYKQCVEVQPGKSKGCLDSRVAAADNYCIKVHSIYLHRNGRTYSPEYRRWLSRRSARQGRSQPLPDPRPPHQAAFRRPCLSSPSLLHPETCL